MEKLTFTADDPRLGTYTAEGGYQSWPTVDAFNKPYERQNATIKRVSPTQFIVVGPDEEKNIEAIEFERKLPTSLTGRPAPKADDPTSAG